MLVTYPYASMASMWDNRDPYGTKGILFLGQRDPYGTKRSYLWDKRTLEGKLDGIDHNFNIELSILNIKKFFNISFF